VPVATEEACCGPETNQSFSASRLLPSTTQNLPPRSTRGKLQDLLHGFAGLSWLAAGVPDVLFFGVDIYTPAFMFRRVRVIGNGSAMIEDIEEYGRVHELFARLRSSAQRYNDHAEGWGITPAHDCTLNNPGVATRPVRSW
jgi:hypothetical protein